MHVWFCPIRLTHPIRWKSLQFVKIRTNIWWVAICCVKYKYKCKWQKCKMALDWLIQWTRQMVYRCLFRSPDALLPLNNTFVISIRYICDLLSVVNDSVYSFAKEKAGPPGWKILKVSLHETKAIGECESERIIHFKCTSSNVRSSLWMETMSFTFVCAYGWLTQGEKDDVNFSA